MTPTTKEPLSLTDEEFTLMGELLESERARVLIGIRHTFHRAYREELRRRLETIEALIKRSGTKE
jgi:hypothetical protein